MKRKLCVLNTRPQHQSQKLTQQIVAIGGNTVDLPLFDIQAVSFEKPTSRFDHVIFLSANAVNCFFSQNRETPLADNIIAIGSATKEALEKKLVHNILCPVNFSSEGILSMPLMQNLKNQSVLIVCGENSKALLQSELIARGANIKVITCYKRVAIRYNMNDIFPKLIEQKVNAVVATSFESLQQLLNLFHASHYRDWLFQQTLCVVTNEMKTKAISCGFHTVIQASNATDQAIVAALQE